MGFRQGAYAKIWSAEDKGNYSIAKVSVSKKNKETGEYDVEFQDGYVRLVGIAHDLIKSMQIPDNGVSVQISSCDVTNKYDTKTKKLYTNFVIFGFETSDNATSNKGATTNKSSKKSASKTDTAPAVDMTDDSDELPF